MATLNPDSLINGGGVDGKLRNLPLVDPAFLGYVPLSSLPHTSLVLSGRQQVRILSYLFELLTFPSGYAHMCELPRRLSR